MTTSSRTTTPTRRIAAGVLAAVAALALAGCSGGSRAGADQPGVDNTVTSAPGQPVKSSIMASSEKDLAASFRTNGVDDPEKWAQVLAQNKPYPAGTEGTQKIQQVLQQNQAEPEVVAQITTLVEP
ncbi:hypothetical protein GCM10023215_53750 [Pseudonocardia yuanmonensis]|uniref:Lipoprotein n=1 Tax=Pseudonocardia yuanmonensis TaxID=1095914 RepID=A0ABP8XEM3_9PSEU